MIERLEYWLDSVVPVSGASMPVVDSSPKAKLRVAGSSPADTKSSDSDTQSVPTTDQSVPSKQVPRSDGQEPQPEPKVEGATAALAGTGDNSAPVEISMPEFPLLPVSKGFVLTCRKLITNFRKVLAKM